MKTIRIEVKGGTGVGKSAVCYEIETLFQALGLDAQWIGGLQERSLNDIDNDTILQFMPKIEIVEINE
jgi:hypothetical protein